MVDRVPCKAPGCNRTILPETAARTGGICMVCERERARAEHQAYVLANRKTVDRFAGVSDPFEIIKLFHQPFRYDPLVQLVPFSGSIREVYRTFEDTGSLQEYAVELLRLGRGDEAEQIARCLGAFTDSDLDVLLRQLLPHVSPLVAIAFRNASDAIRSQLFAALHADGTRPDSILRALAWAGGEEVTAAFSEWTARPPDWSSKLYVPPAQYAQEAGWGLDREGNRRDLFSSTCYGITFAKGTANRAVAVFERISERCPWCASTLVDLVRFDRSDESLRPILGEVPVRRVRICDQCSCFTTIFSRETDERIWWNDEPVHCPRDAGISYGFPDNVGIERISERGIYEAADQFLPISFSQFGGLPAWVQDPAYPNCPDCGQLMRFIFQIATDDVMPPAEGITYGFFCDPCRISAVNYQQT